MKPWLTVIGIGEDGMAGLSAAARRLVEGAEVIVGGDRHQSLAPDVKAERITWPSPFDALIETLKAQRGRRIVVLVTGDPLWYSVGARLLKAIPAAEIAFHPQLSAFQWAASRMGWSLADVETLTAHGRDAAQVVPYFWPGARLIILTAGSQTPGEIARLLAARGYGASAMTVLASLGGPEERRIDGVAGDWANHDPIDEIPAFHTLAVACAGAPKPLLSRLPGLPDEAFASDGVMTKREVRAVTLARLMPARGEVLWDIGCGCGSVAVEWMRAAADALAVGIDPKPDRLELARRNALALGAPKLELLEGRAPEALALIPSPAPARTDLRRPNAVFIGGGLSRETVTRCLMALRPGGRLVANAVTLDSEALLIALHRELGGDLTRIGIDRAAPLGELTGWRPAMPVVQWSLMA
ncbi:MAG TPA: precorrin-6y C5,15-methyltransferase (decarboxylating) subunit CbiE [Thermohalobaculum sp.]|nr:precorrin-6y C5,15-methyltransferase (decarboxylating) subunit CbiE [Thermohalobaculum sp.]